MVIEIILWVAIIFMIAALIHHWAKGDVL